VHTLLIVDYEWDPAKAAENFRKHRVRFADAALSLEDPFGRSAPDPDAAGESRLVYLGADPSGRVLVTVYTLRERTVRIISSRKSSRAERRTYETDA
jgi:uncharacterized protein